MRDKDTGEVGGHPFAGVVGGLLLTITALWVAADDPMVEDVRPGWVDIGYVLGSLLAPILLAIGARYLWVRWGGGRAPIVDWAWILLIAGVIAAGVMIAGIANEDPVNLAMLSVPS